MANWEQKPSPHVIGTIATAILVLAPIQTTAREVQVAPGVETHYRKHRDEFDMDRAEAMLPEIVANPRAVYVGNKANSLVFIEDWDAAYLLAVSVKVLPNELWIETPYVTKTTRFFRRRWTQKGPLYVRRVDK